MKKLLLIAATTVALLGVLFLCLPHYARQALIHRHPVITDLQLFSRHVVAHRPDSVWQWPHAARYNSHSLCAADARYLDSLRTVSFLVIQNDSLLFEHYAADWSDTLTSNIYSATKTIVALLTGIALDEGHIHSLDDPVSRYLPQYTRGRQADVTIRHLLTMSGAMAWDEAYSSLFSVTTHGYYGDDLYDLVTRLDVTDTPGRQYTYRSGETQLLAFVLEAATGTTLSDYAQHKLWQPLQAEHDAYWLLDKPDGDEKAFCCFHTTARDVARFGRLLLNHGQWNGRQLVSRAYIDEMLRPASHLLNQWGNGPLSYYGYLTWIITHHGEPCPFMRGMLGQYIITIPSRNAIIVRLGKKRCDIYDGPFTTDIPTYIDIAMKMLAQKDTSSQNN